MTGVWEAGVAGAVERRRFVFVGSGTALLDQFRASGAEVVGFVSVGLAGAPPVEHEHVPVLSLGAATTSWLELQAEGFADTVDAALPRVLRFLDAVDPARSAVVVGNMTVPGGATGGRTCWAPESAAARAIEEKRATGAVLDRVVPWIPSQPVPARVDDDWWRRTTAASGTGRVVIQRLGPGAGGVTTWICDDPRTARAAVEAAGPRGARVSPFVDGVPVNVMGCVLGDGGVLVLPASRQIVMHRNHQPIYAGNDGPGCPAADAVVAHARRAGRALAARGYLGPFGLDAVVPDDGHPRFHDLNARINGSVHLFNLSLPVYDGLMTAPGWLSAAAVAEAEAEVHESIRSRPLARWALVTTLARPARVPALPGAAACRIDVDTPALVPVGDEGPDVPGGDLVVLRTRLAEGTELPAGRDVTVADLWCDPEVSARLLARHGSAAAGRLADAVLAGFPAVAPGP